jgi:hypothetical protein
MDSQIALQQPILDGGIRSINFFNGRLLSARDLTREQSAYREADRRLGQAIGEGIAYGLEVSKSLNSTEAAPAVTVEAGLAVNRTGQTLMLSGKTEVALVRRASPNGGTVQPFGECLPLQTGTYIAGAGVYLLTLAPAQSTEGRAITSGLNSGTASCNTDTMVTAVQFRLIQLEPQITAGEMLDQTHLRNLIAYKCFGVSETSAFAQDPFAANLEQYGLLDSLRPNRLTDCDVPLGILYWTLVDGIKFIDMWSVRRRPARKENGTRWKNLVSERRSREIEAMVLQFKEQIDDFGVAALETMVATDRFNYLPPAGLLPAAQESFGGVVADTFFSGFAHRAPQFIDVSTARALLREAINHEPIDLSRKEMVWLYKVWQNSRDFKTGAARPFLLFSTAYMRNAAIARFDVAHWDYANYGRCEA